MRSGTTSTLQIYHLPNHPGDMPESILRDILKQAGIAPDDFLEKIECGGFASGPWRAWQAVPDNQPCRQHQSGKKESQSAVAPGSAGELCIGNAPTPLQIHHFVQCCSTIRILDLPEPVRRVIGGVALVPLRRAALPVSCPRFALILLFESIYVLF